MYIYLYIYKYIPSSTHTHTRTGHRSVLQHDDLDAPGISSVAPQSKKGNGSCRTVTGAARVCASVKILKNSTLLVSVPVKSVAS